MHIQKYIDAIKAHAPARTDVLEIARALHAKNALGTHHTTGALIVLDGYAVREHCPELLAFAQMREVPAADADFDTKLEIAAANMRAQGIATTIGGGGPVDALGFDSEAIAAFAKANPMGRDQ